MSKTSYDSSKPRPAECRTEGFTKYDQGKLRMELVPVELTVGAARALTFGANKYTAGNWKLCEYWSRYLGALLRHITAWQAGENLDPETGYSHLDCAAACLSFLMAFEARGLGTDDRGDL